MELNVQKRTAGKQLGQLRSEGGMPAVFYGKETESTPIALDVGDFVRVWHKAGESTVITLKADDGEHQALIQDVDVHPVTEYPLHADFYVFEEGQTLTVSIPLTFVGEAPAINNFDATLVKVLHELEIEAQPKDLPHDIAVDVSGLEEINDSITVGDLDLPAGVSATADPEDTVVLVSEIVEEEEEEEVVMDFSDIEVEGERPAEGEEGEAVPEGGVSQEGREADGGQEDDTERE